MSQAHRASGGSRAQGARSLVPDLSPLVGSSECLRDSETFLSEKYFRNINNNKKSVENVLPFLIGLEHLWPREFLGPENLGLERPQVSRDSGL